MTDLERTLREAGRTVDWPPAPELASAVGARLRGERAPAPRHPAVRVRRGLALAAAGLVLVLTGSAVAFPGVRDAVLDWLGIGGVRVERVPERPQLPAGARGELDLGPETTLAAAGERAGFTVRRLRPLGAPDSVHERGGRVSLVYRGGRLLVTQFRGTGAVELIHKELGPGTRAEQVMIGRLPGVFVSGEPHAFVYQAPDGQIRRETARLAGNTLLWEDLRGVTIRIEGRDLGRGEALRLARSTR